jgi:hypothetical protein
MRRPVLYVVLSFLLLVMQGQVLVHPFAHLDAHATRPDRVEAALPHAAAACFECALLVAGSDTVHFDAPNSHLASGTVLGALTAFRSRTTAAPVYFASRAPPVLL